MAYLFKKVKVLVDNQTIEFGPNKELRVKDLGISTPKIADLAVTTPKIANNAITTEKIADNAITTSKIADNSITTSKIVNNAITTEKIADMAVNYWKLANGAVGTEKIANGAVTYEKLAFGTFRSIGAFQSINNDTKIDIPNPDGSMADMMIVRFFTQNGSGTSATIRVSVNNDTTTSRYEIQRLTISGSSVSASRANDNSLFSYGNFYNFVGYLIWINYQDRPIIHIEGAVYYLASFPPSHYMFKATLVYNGWNPISSVQLYTTTTYGLFGNAVAWIGRR